MRLIHSVRPFVKNSSRFVQIRDQTDTVQGKKNEPASNETAEFNVQYIHKRFDTRLRAYSLVV